MNIIPLPQLSRQIQESTGKVFSYKQLYKAALNRRIPAQQTRTRRWVVLQDDLNTIVRHMETCPVCGQKSCE